jgi:outer membrane biosynthesis protein TonB
MKKHRDADKLAKRIMEAASKPPGITSTPRAAPEPMPVKIEEPPKAAEPAAPPAPVKVEQEPRAPKKAVKREAKKAANDDTVPMSLRPPRSTLQRYVQAAAHCTQAVGRVVSVQEIILEVMERGP